MADQLEEHKRSIHLKCDLCTEVLSTEDELKEHQSLKHPENCNCDLCDYNSTSKEGIESHKKDVHVIVACTYCDTFIDTTFSLRTNIENEHATMDKAKVTSEKDYIQQIANENSALKAELRSVKDDFERLSDIYKKEQHEFKELKLNIGTDLSKTRDEYKRLKIENGKLIAQYDMLFKLGNISLEQNINKSYNTSKDNEEDTIEIVEE